MTDGPTPQPKGPEGAWEKMPPSNTALETLDEKMFEIDRIHRSLTNQTPDEVTVARIEALRVMVKIIGAQIIDQCPPSRERSLALTHLEETAMWAVKSLVLPR